jgi:fibrillarin-like rRNA methylase
MHHARLGYADVLFFDLAQRPVDGVLAARADALAVEQGVERVSVDARSVGYARDGLQLVTKA